MEPFKFYWDRFNARAGFNYIAGIFILFLISKWIEFPWFVVGLSAVLAWLVVLLGKAGNKILMIFLYLVVGLGLTLLSCLFADTYWPWLISMFIVTFLGTFLVRFGVHWYMLGWSLILWFMLMPVLGEMGNPQELLISHILGSSIVLILVFFEVVWKRFGNKLPDEIVAESQGAKPMPMWWTITYAVIVALVMVIGLILGHQYLDSDPTMISNSAFMIIGFTGIIIWKAGLERMLAATLAIVFGFYLGVVMQSEVLGIVLIVITSFFVLALLEVNNGAVIFFFLVIIGYGWGLKDFETGNAIANERLLAEFAGVLLAGIAITSMNLLSKLITRSGKKNL
jgi:hypothetical protein